MMRRGQWLMLVFILLFPAAYSHAQNWTGILDPSRAIDWSYAGVRGGIPARTTNCATLTSTASASQIQSALNSCPSGQVVSLSAGTYSLNSGLTIPSNVTLRGAGANKTILNFTGTSSYYWGSYLIGFTGNYDNASDGTSPGFGGCGGTCTQISWTGTNGAIGTYTKGAIVINLASVPNGLTAGMMLMLVQNDDAAPTTGFFVCQDTTQHCSRDGGGYSYHNTSNRENHEVVSVSGTSVTLAEPIGMSNWRTSQSPIAYYQACCETRQAGVEELAIVDNTGASICGPISVFQSEDSWVSGVSVQASNNDRTSIQLFLDTHITIQNSWIGTMNGGSCGSVTGYGIEPMANSYLLLLNNVLDRVQSPILFSGQNFGSVTAYNYINQYTGSGGDTGIMMHDVGWAFGLIEGNETDTIYSDVEHGNHNFGTLFRNFSPGTNQSAINIYAMDRYFNAVANVLGNTSGQAAYQAMAPSTCGNCDRFSNNMFRVGYPEGSNSLTGNSPGLVPADPIAVSSFLRWGNYDTFTATVHWCGASNNTGWSAVCGGISEIPISLTQFANAVPTVGDTGAGQPALPASFFYSSQPSWWPSGKPWPYVGPEVTGGNIQGYAGHAYTSPAHDCFSGAGGNIANFNAAACYGSTTTSSAPQPPQFLQVSVQ